MRKLLDFLAAASFVLIAIVLVSASILATVALPIALARWVWLNT